MRLVEEGAVEALRAPTASDPWRVLVSGCLAGWACGVNGDDYGLGAVLRDGKVLPGVSFVPFCPEQHGLGVPRPMPDLHGGDGFDVLAGRARIRGPDGADLTDGMLCGARAMLRLALEARVDFALLTDASAACGSVVVHVGNRADPAHDIRRGVGVAAALLLAAGIPVVSQRDFRTLARLRVRLDPSCAPEPGLLDHRHHPWVVANLPPE